MRPWDVDSFPLPESVTLDDIILHLSRSKVILAAMYRKGIFTADEYTKAQKALDDTLDTISSL